MKKLLVTLAMITVMFFAVSVQAAYIETFDSGNATWFYGYGSNFTSPQNNATWNGSGGNPGGYISGASNNLYAVWTYTTAPYGDMTGLSLTIDTKVAGQGLGNAQFYVGRGGTYFINGTWAVGSDTAWTTHTVALDSTHFSSWTGLNNYVYTLAQVLQAPDDIGIFFGGSVASGTGNVLVDNFGTTSVPEPTSMLLFGLGLLGLAGVRRKLKK